ncbi:MULTISPECIES: archaetidylserine decarboxylase [unclassified Marinimicrobium]|jgi:phosphatidylserine decarboxylase|uniref:archaetidylserine decarboxylase n=1 Tax=unclassified Marinimicrobium TaxID=2632100 RepID=UPI00257FADA9|nr:MULTISPECIES: archaetidylserine decarboxylase [unclassified Marinimicrobium]|tara:strand:- start:113 stop:964 length:852 start_codon:yes stop_codon:yes gene_type:complete
MNEKLFAALQYITPQHGLSRAAGWLANQRTDWIKNHFIEWFIQRYGVDMSEALEENPRAYAHFNDFFTRALKPDARPLDASADSIVCPADGAISQLGAIEDGRIFQAKGQLYTTRELLGGSEALAAEFDQGQFATIYLSPKDYHRVHMPFDGQLRATVAIPGDLFSVNTATANQVPRLFSRNERLVAIFDTDIGPMAVVLVGAMIVAGIETVWGGEVAPIKRTIQTRDFRPRAPITLNKGEEMGRFKLGSTAIVLFGKDRVRWDEAYQAGRGTRMGERLGVRL